jgi:stearoyl-CoA desaturase (Delta-9 desaturase)
LTVAGTLALEGEPTRWVADHRRHHAFSDRDGDPHSPWRYGESVRGVAKGLLYAHCGWFFEGGLTNRQRFAPDLLADQDIGRIDRMVVPLSVASLLAPAVVGGLLSWSWQGALTAFFWGGLVRMALAHHVTCSINSVCHVVGDRPFRTRKGDRAANFWPLALLSFGESWHNSHHADPTCARHGVLRGQIDPAAPADLVVRAAWLGACRTLASRRPARRSQDARTDHRPRPEPVRVAQARVPSDARPVWATRTRWDTAGQHEQQIGGHRLAV